jgi:hypothetical protein
LNEVFTRAAEDWQTRRSALNHDWLRNRFLNRLNAFIMRLQSEVRNDDAIGRFLTADLKEWPDKATSLRWLLDSFETQMSPAALANEPPLCRLDAGIRRWLAEVAHLAWLARLPVTLWIQTASAELDEAQGLYTRLCARGEDANDTESRPRLAAEFQEFETQCRRLSEALSGFPSKIVV